MAKHKKSDEKDDGLVQGQLNFFKNLKDETFQGILALLLALLAVILVLSSLEEAGVAGRYIFSSLTYLLGYGYYLLPIICITLSVIFFKDLDKKFEVSKLAGSLIFLLSGLGIIETISLSHGGKVGFIISYPVVALFDKATGLIILSATLIISIFITLDTNFIVHVSNLFKALFTKKEKVDLKGVIGKEEEEKIEKAVQKKEAEIATNEKEDARKVKKDIKAKEPTIHTGETDESGISLKALFAQAKNQGEFTPPPLDLLEKDRGKPGVGDIKANANIIKRTLQNFGISVEMDEISIGPSVTRYALKPAEGVKLSRIVGLQNDLALALAAHPIRIEAPIPGKSLVGIEIPNSTKTTVGLGTLLSNDEFQKSDKPLLVALGKGISGKSFYSNIAKMPHLLIAGATGSGKSVTIHAIITSLLYRKSPFDLRFIMIDPKRVELTLYNKIPHLLTPVITDAKKAILALKWAAKEMDRRYDVLETEKVRDIESYHKNIVSKTPKLKVKEGDKEVEEVGPETMPYIVIVIDELADIMQTYPRELESSIVRLAQMSRAVGIHLMLSTQRPSVNVITGLIKANIPARIALQVSSQIDSRTILDCGGAEKLLGAGDMLYLSGEMSQPQRIQSSYISETELKNVVSHIVDSFKNEIPLSPINLTGPAAMDSNSIFEATLDSDDNEEDDELYEDARAVVMEAGKASTSYIQRKLRVGYSRAARLMDLLQERGVIGAADGSKARSVVGAGESTLPSEGDEIAQDDEETADSDDVSPSIEEDTHE